MTHLIWLVLLDVFCVRDKPLLTMLVTAAVTIIEAFIREFMMNCFHSGIY